MTKTKTEKTRKETNVPATKIRNFKPGKIERRYVSCAPETKACPGMVTIAEQTLVQFANSQSIETLRGYREWLNTQLSRFGGPPHMELRTLDDDEIEGNADYFGVLLGIPMLDSNGSGNVFMVRRLGFTESPIPRNTQMLRRDVHKVFQSLALHEVDEWLKFDGAHVEEPHPDLN